MRDSGRLNHLETLRAHELELVLRRLPPSGRILEVGAGYGWQARRLSQQGYEVIALDVEDSQLRPLRVYSVKPYDGRRIPFPDNYFDVVYSSNVLEHVLELGTLEKEIRRVLSRNGVAVHVLPTPAWRAWTTLTHPIYLLQLIYHARRSHLELHKDRRPVNSKRLSVSHFWRYIISPHHGCRGTVVHELYLFSYRYWSRHFSSCGWKVASYSPCRLFYSGNQILHNRLEIGLRNRLARYLGSATALWILRKAYNDE
jgi:SAM-dependent methyltransferase